jgi:hypothetical protein
MTESIPDPKSLSNIVNQYEPINFRFGYGIPELEKCIKTSSEFTGQFTHSIESLKCPECDENLIELWQDKEQRRICEKCYLLFVFDKEGFRYVKWVDEKPPTVERIFSNKIVEENKNQIKLAYDDSIPPVGIKNKNYFCWLISFVQILFHIPIFRDVCFFVILNFFYLFHFMNVFFCLFIYILLNIFHLYLLFPYKNVLISILNIV